MKKYRRHIYVVDTGLNNPLRILLTESVHYLLEMKVYQGHR
jgi:hypothetical protein